jgi:hypothetical protein
MNIFNSLSNELKLEEHEDQSDPRVALIEVAAFIDRTDNEGTIWPKGLFKSLCMNITTDGRYQFMDRFARSAFFGELIVKEYAEAQLGDCTDEMIRCGRILNLFVTAFDSVCDEITEELPETLKALNELFSVFPNQVVSRSKIEYSLSGFTLSLAYELAEVLGNAIRVMSADHQRFFTKKILFAFESQVHELSVNMTKADVQPDIIDSKSIGPFATGMIIPHVLSAETKNIDCIQPVSIAMGRLFGWVDDLADWQEDSFANKTTSLTLFLRKESVTELDLLNFSSSIEKETINRYDVLYEELSNYNLIKMDGSLKSAMKRWLF